MSEISDALKDLGKTLGNYAAAGIYVKGGEVLGNLGDKYAAVGKNTLAKADKGAASLRAKLGGLDGMGIGLAIGVVVIIGIVFMLRKR